MKKKATTYLLGALVILIWGIIIYRVIDATDEQEDERVFNNSMPKKTEAYNDYSIQADTAKLLLNYPDPFRLRLVQDTTLIPVGKLTNSTPTTQPVKPNRSIPPEINWNFIQYSGYVRNPSTKKLFALVKVNGKSLMLSEGESGENVKLLKNLKDSIKVSYQGKIKFIRTSTEGI